MESRHNRYVGKQQQQQQELSPRQAPSPGAAISRGGGRTRQNLSPVRPDLGRSGPNSADFGQCWADAHEFWGDFDHTWSNGETKMGRSRPDVDRLPPYVARYGRIRTDLDKLILCGGDVDKTEQIWAEAGQDWAEFEVSLRH